MKAMSEMIMVDRPDKRQTLVILVRGFVRRWADEVTLTTEDVGHRSTEGQEGGRGKSIGRADPNVVLTLKIVDDVR